MNTTTHAVSIVPRSAVATLLAGALSLSFLPAQSNLLINGNFTGGLAPWTTVAGNPATVIPYSTSPFPAATLPNTIGGGSQFLLDGGNSVVEQVVVPASMAPGMSVIVHGYLGGFGGDGTRMALHFRDAAGNVLLREVTPYVTSVQRNQEPVLLVRELVAQVPAGAVDFAVRIEFNDNCCNGVEAAADNFSAQLVNGTVTPPALPLNTELLRNPGFESGWTTGSPLNIDQLQAWEGLGPNRVLVVPYSDTPTNPRVPNGSVSCVIGGAAPNPSCGPGTTGQLLLHDGNMTLRQRLDLRGNAPQLATVPLALRCSAFLGGAANNTDRAQVVVTCRDIAGQSLASAALGQVEASHRNYETVLVRREQQIPVPPATRFVDVAVTFVDDCCTIGEGSVDNISIVLATPTSVPAVPLQSNLISNGSFEIGSVGGSPLELTNANGWFGIAGNNSASISYGANNAPSVQFTIGNNLGALLLRDAGNGDSELRQIIDLTGSQALIANGLMAMSASAWLGGVTSSTDRAEVRIHFETITGAQVGLPVQLGPVTAAMRANQTTLLLQDSGTFGVPINAARVVVDLICTDDCCSGPFAMADDIRLVAFDGSAQATASPYPGTGGDLVLMTGINSEPTTGLGQFVKDADPGDVLWIKVASPQGMLDGSLLLVGVNAFPNGQPPIPSFPGLSLDLGSLALLSFGGPLFPPVVVPLPYGNQLTLLLPPAFQSQSLLLQAVCLPLPGAPVPANGIFFSSEGHEIR